MEQEIEQNVVTTSKKNKGIEREREDDLDDHARFLQHNNTSRHEKYD